MSCRLKSIASTLICVLLVACGSDSKPESSPISVPTALAPAPKVESDFVTFESAAVRPLALSENGKRLYVTNTPNSTLDIFTLSDNGPEFELSVPVGLEPVAVALNGQQAWVVNHLSDSVSIIDISAAIPHVVKTLLVGDEPRDIVFAGTEGTRAFITTAHRGQNGPDDQPLDAQLASHSVARADVWVFDAIDTGASLGGEPIKVVSLFGDTPRAMTVSPDGSRVYVAVMHSGNRTTTIAQVHRLAKPGPSQSSDGAVQPETGLIVQFDGKSWRDETGSTTDLNNVSYDDRVPFSLPDYDVFGLSANADLAVTQQISGVGTTLFNMVSNPVSGHVYVTNTEALNVNRFEGHGHTTTTVRGNFVQSRISILSDDGVQYRNLNKHLDHSQQTASEQDRQLSTAQPMGMTISNDGSILYVAGFGSNKVLAYDTESLESDEFTVDAAQQVKLQGGGPVAVVLDEARNRLYALTRFNNSVAVVDTNLLAEIGSVAMANPEPAHVIAGREFLYNAIDNSSHGDSSCGLCHVSGDTDALAWDLGNPDATVVSDPNEYVNDLVRPPYPPVFHPMKGPMTTQSFRGLANSGPMHWRGDRTGQSAKEGESLELAAFKEFNVAFPELLGRDTELDEEQMTLFAQFALEIQYPPNPIRALDNSLTSDQAAGEHTYFNEVTTMTEGQDEQCNMCHLIARI